jgi:TonB family protein
MLATFYLLYNLILKKETFFKLDRLYLISSLLFSITIPFLDFDLYSIFNSDVNLVGNIQNLKNGYNELNEVVIYAYSGKLTFAAVMEYSKAIYLLGVLISSVFFLFGLGKICWLIIRNSSQNIDKYRIIETTDNVVSFSLFKWIIINPEKHSSEDLKQIIAHEKIHAFQLHSLDLIFIEVLVILFWFNPFIYWYRKSIREVHEYLADQAVVENGFDYLDYQKLLFKQAAGNRFIGLTSRFSYSLSKNRLKMLTMMKSKNILKTKIVLAIPFALAFIFFFANSTEFAKATNNTSIEREIVAPDDTVKVETDSELEGKIFFIVQKMPKFQGQESDAFRPFVQSNLKYPEEAQKKGISGRVFIQFDIDKEGNARNIKVIRGVHPSLDAEAIRVTELSPKWEPGEQSGEKVNVRFTFPIVFALKEDK